MIASKFSTSQKRATREYAGNACNEKKPFEEHGYVVDMWRRANGVGK
jgi:hypothetical protein